MSLNFKKDENPREENHRPASILPLMLKVLKGFSINKSKILTANSCSLILQKYSIIGVGQCSKYVSDSISQ